MDFDTNNTTPQREAITFSHIVIHKSAGVPHAALKVVNFQGLT
ncbi:hypothetical protein [Janthinobacterium svalbardensis]|nr:hypothetical protein [Janthinobacterium svalbardensis]